MNVKGLIIIMFITVLVLPVMGNGFKLFEWGAHGTGLAGAFVARSGEPTSLFYNPAGMTGSEGTQIYLGGLYTSRQFSFFSPDLDLSIDSSKASFLLPNFALTRQLSKKLWLGLVVYSPSNYKITWPFTQRHPLVYRSRKMELAVYNISPGIAWQLNDKFSLGCNLGINFSTSEFKMHYDYDFIITHFTSGLVMDAEDFVLALEDCKKISLAVTFGLQWKWSKRLTFGLTVYGDLGSKYQVGRLDFKETDTPLPELNELLASIFKDSPQQDATCRYWDIPSIKAGLAWQVSDSFTLEIDAYWELWSILDGMEVVFNPEINWPGVLGLDKIEENYKCSNPLSLRIGGEYLLSNKLSLRMGVFRDPNPMPDDTYSPMYPFSDQWGITMGLGYQWKQFFFDLAYRLLLVSDKNVTNETLDRWGIKNQEYGSRSEHLFSLGVGCRF